MGIHNSNRYWHYCIKKITYLFDLSFSLVNLKTNKFTWFSFCNKILMHLCFSSSLSVGWTTCWPESFLCAVPSGFGTPIWQRVIRLRHSNCTFVQLSCCIGVRTCSNRTTSKDCCCCCRICPLRAGRPLISACLLLKRTVLRSCLQTLRIICKAPEPTVDPDFNGVWSILLNL